MIYFYHIVYCGDQKIKRSPVIVLSNKFFYRLIVSVACWQSGIHRQQPDSDQGLAIAHSLALFQSGPIIGLLLRCWTRLSDVDVS